MGKYIQKNLTKNEEIILEAKISKLPLISAWITGILFCWLLLIPFFKAIQKTIKYRNTILGFTNKRVIGKQRGNKTITLDAPLNKVQSVGTSNTFWGRVFNYGDITIRTAAGEF
ncbi:MAG: PH domain-containing protein [Bacilli bacterium]|nr:PH domain-containing protein [Bacilli bacterium]MDD4056687.1 PH domain-containing protein [Bacilli bacterium]